MKSILAVLALLLSLTACNANQNNTHSERTNPTPAQQTTPASQDNKAQGIWIDVRSPKEYNEGHLTGAVNLVHTDIVSQIASIAPNKNEPIHVYCHSGRRAEAALQELQKLGYTNVTNHGGYADLVKKGVK